DPLLDHRALELGKSAGDREDQLAHRRRRVDRLLIEVKVHAARFQLLDGVQQVRKRAADTVNRPSHHNVKLPLLGVVQHPVEPGTVLATLGAGYASVVVDLNHLPAAALRNLTKLNLLIPHRLLVSAYTKIESGPARHWKSPSNVVRFRGPQGSSVRSLWRRFRRRH